MLVPGAGGGGGEGTELQPGSMTKLCRRRRGWPHRSENALDATELALNSGEDGFMFCVFPAVFSNT